VGEKNLKGVQDGKFDFEAGREKIWFAKQTIMNACGTQALLGIVLNNDGEEKEGKIEIGEELGGFKEFTGMFEPEDRGEALSNHELIREVHNSFAKSSPFVDETTRDGGEKEDVFHFVAYTVVQGELWEIDGLQEAPISHGKVEKVGKECFEEKVIEVVTRRVERYEGGEIMFNLLALCRDLRVKARELGDFEMLEREEMKREAWIFENSLRRHNFVGFAGEVLKGVVKGKLGEGEDKYREWIEEAKRKTKARAEEGRKKKGGDEDEEMSG